MVNHNMSPGRPSPRAYNNNNNTIIPQGGAGERHRCMETTPCTPATTPKKVYERIVLFLLSPEMTNDCSQGSRFNSRFIHYRISVCRHQQPAAHGFGYLGETSFVAVNNKFTPLYLLVCLLSSSTNQVKHVAGKCSFASPTLNSCEDHHGVRLM